MFLFNLLLALAWTALTGQFTALNLIVGFFLAYLILWLVQHQGETPSYFKRVIQVLSFMVFFIRELIIANLRVAYEVLTPPHTMHPGIIAVPLDVTSNAEITLLANLITLTPGTLSLDVSTDRRVLYVHAMHVTDVDRFRRDIKEGFERRIQEIFR